jgi:hypothetical protein
MATPVIESSQEQGLIKRCRDELNAAGLDGFIRDARDFEYTSRTPLPMRIRLTILRALRPDSGQNITEVKF